MDFVLKCQWKYFLFKKYHRQKDMDIGKGLAGKGKSFSERRRGMRMEEGGQGRVKMTKVHYIDVWISQKIK